MFKVSSLEYNQPIQEALFTDVDKAMAYYESMKNQIFIKNETRVYEFVTFSMKYFDKYEVIKKYDFKLFEKNKQYQTEIYNLENLLL